MRNHFLIVAGFLAISFVYYLTMLPGLGFHDVAELQWVVRTLQIAHPTGFPSYILLGFLLTYLMPGDPAGTVNFLSLLYSVIGLLFLYLINKMITKSSFASFIGVCFVAFSIPIWNYAGMADTHTFGRMFLLMIIYFTLRIEEKYTSSRLLLLSFLTGLSLGGHLFILYALPFLFGYLLFVLLKKYLLASSVGKSKILKAIGFASGGLLAGLSTYLFLPLRSLVGPEILPYSLATWDGFFRHVSGADFQGLMFQGGISAVFSNMARGIQQLALWSGFGVVLFCFGVIRGFITNKATTAMFLLMMVSLLTFATNYPTSDESRYFGWIIILSGIFIAWGTKFILHVFKDQTFTLVFQCSMIFWILLSVTTSFSQMDKHNDHQAQTFVDGVINQAEPSAVVLSWWHYMTPIRFEQTVLGKRGDILLINDSPGGWLEYADRYINLRPVYVVSEEESLKKYYTMTTRGSLYKLEKKN